MILLKLSSKLNFPGPKFALALSLLNREQDTNLSQLKLHLTIAKHNFLLSKKNALSVHLFLSFLFYKGLPVYWDIKKIIKVIS